MDGGGGSEDFDLTRRRGGAEKDAEKKVEGQEDREPRLPWRRAETAENVSRGVSTRQAGVPAPRCYLVKAYQHPVSRMDGGGGNEAFDLTRRRGGAEKDAEKKVEGQEDREPRLPWRRAETAENVSRGVSTRQAGVPAPRCYLVKAYQHPVSRMDGGGGNEAFDLTRRRGGAEKDAEKKVEGQEDREPRLPWRRAETAENVSRGVSTRQAGVPAPRCYLVKAYQHPARRSLKVARRAGLGIRNWPRNALKVRYMDWARGMRRPGPVSTKFAQSWRLASTVRLPFQWSCTPPKVRPARDCV